MSEVTLTIDSQLVTVPKGTLIVEAARKLGIEIPVYCYHPKLAPVGACRVCVVDVEKQRRPIMPACATEVMEGMVVHTRNPAATAAREGVLELLLINHPLDCPVCDRGGECDLQDFTLRYGPPRTRFTETKRHYQKSKTIGREVVLDRERCIMCMRCVRFCDEVAVEKGLSIIERGVKSEIGPFPGTSFDSQFSGNTVEICPVGALTSKTYRFKSRPWELQNYSSICNGCSVGCNVTVDVRYDEVVRLRSRVNDHIDDGWLCDKGRYGFEFINSKERLTSPMIRRNGSLQVATWDEALKAAAEGLRKFAPEDVGLLAGPKVSNEAGWLMVRLARGLLGTANLSVRGAGAEILPLSAKIEGCDTASAIIVIDCDPTATQPVLDLRIKKGLRKGAALINIGAKNGLSSYADVELTSLSQLSEALVGYTRPEPTGLKHPKPRPWEPGGKTSQDVALATEIAKRSGHVVLIFEEKRAPEGLKELAETLGCLSQAPYGLLMLVAGANSTGLREMGVSPVPAEKTDALKEAWGAYHDKRGKSSGCKALITVAEKVESKPEFLVSLDLFANEHADVILPACSHVEQAMTMTSMDGTVQLCRQALPPKGDSAPDWQILLRLAKALGQEWDTDSAARIFAQIGRLNPLYQGASYADFQTDASLHWSYPQQARIGTPRADLAAMPTTRADATPWTLAEPTQSKVENVGRLNRGDTVPAVPGQEDPRRVAARLSLEMAIQSAPDLVIEGPPSRVLAAHGPQPPGPSPAQRYHHIGTYPNRPHSAPPEPEPTVEPSVEEAGKV